MWTWTRCGLEQGVDLNKAWIWIRNVNVVKIFKRISRLSLDRRHFFTYGRTVLLWLLTRWDCSRDSVYLARGTKAWAKMGRVWMHFYGVWGQKVTHVTCDRSDRSDRWQKWDVSPLSPLSPGALKNISSSGISCGTRPSILLHTATDDNLWQLMWRLTVVATCHWNNLRYRAA